MLRNQEFRGHNRVNGRFRNIRRRDMQSTVAILRPHRRLIERDMRYRCAIERHPPNHGHEIDNTRSALIDKNVPTAMRARPHQRLPGDSGDASNAVRCAQCLPGDVGYLRRGRYSYGRSQDLPSDARNTRGRCTRSERLASYAPRSCVGHDATLSPYFPALTPDAPHAIPVLGSVLNCDPAHPKLVG
jgi:hypothetical protein